MNFSAKRLFGLWIGLFSLWLCLPSLALASSDAQADIDAFVQATFGDAPVEPKSLWITGDKKGLVTQILGHPYAKIRLPYWQQGRKRLYVLEEIGKTLPITVGIVIEHQAIQQVQIIKFRESRGWEVKLKSFTDQFFGAFYQNHQLSKSIDGISGATLSVKAVSALAKMALALDKTLEPQP